VKESLQLFSAKNAKRNVFHSQMASKNTKKNSQYHLQSNQLFNMPNIVFFSFSWL